MKSKIKLLGFIAVCACVLSSCKDKNDGVETGNEFPTEFQKVWQEDEFAAEGDEIGVHFTDNKVIVWDYDGDNFDEGEWLIEGKKCHLPQFHVKDSLV